MHELQKMYPSLTLFSDLNWDNVTAEYEQDYIDLSFPEYMQQKALDGDCPIYLFELAFYELALFTIKNCTDPFPHQPAVYLNPTALFLSLEFDVKRMLDDAAQGKIDIHQHSHVLCLYRDTHDEIHVKELSGEALELLQHLEDGPQEGKDFFTKDKKSLFENLVIQGIILDLMPA